MLYAERAAWFRKFVPPPKLRFEWFGVTVWVGAATPNTNLHRLEG